MFLVGHEFRHVTVVITGHLEVEDAGFSLFDNVHDEDVFQKVEDILADGFELGLNLLLVFNDELIILAVIDVQSSPRGSASTNNVLEGNGKEVAFLNGQIDLSIVVGPFDKGTHDDAHILITFGSLSGLGHEDKSITVLLEESLEVR